jgi:hypothetical protein
VCIAAAPFGDCEVSTALLFVAVGLLTVVRPSSAVWGAAPLLLLLCEVQPVFYLLLCGVTVMWPPSITVVM